MGGGTNARKEFISGVFIMARVEMTEMCYPDKITIERFQEEVEKGIRGFVKNMNDYPSWVKPQFAEEWMSRFANWMEMEKE